MVGGPGLAMLTKTKGWNKRVESVWFPCADEGSNPSSSTPYNKEGVS